MKNDLDFDLLPLTDLLSERRDEMKRVLIFGTMLLSLLSLLSFEIFHFENKKQGSCFIPIGKVDMSDEYEDYEDGNDEVGVFERFITTHKTPLSKRIVK